MSSNIKNGKEIEIELVEPGSRAAAEKVSALGHGGLPDRYTNEGQAEHLEGKELASAFVIRDAFESDLAARAALRRMGSGVPIPTDEIAQPYVDANPDRDFRWMTTAHCEKRGDRGWSPVYDPKGKKVTHLNEKRWLAHKPKDVREEQLAEYRRRGQEAKTAAYEAMDGVVERAGAANKGTGTIGNLPTTHPMLNRGK